MAERTYLSLPINADEGFPQAFRLAFNGQTYQFSLYVNVLESAADALLDPMELPTSGAFMVMRVFRENGASLESILLRKVVLNHEYEAAELAFQFQEITVARGNLNGVGSFGSRVVAGIAAR